jgi:hypothetical protein
MFRCLLWAIAAVMRPKMLLIADNLCLRQQLLVLKRRQPRPRIKDAHRRFWILACRWFVGWQSSVLCCVFTERVGARIGAGVHAELGGRAAAQFRWN